MTLPDFLKKPIFNRQNVLSIFLSTLFFFSNALPASAQETENLSIFEDAYPSWSPDGTKIVFHSTRTGDEDQLFATIACAM